jgi:hypothetical protein
MFPRNDDDATVQQLNVAAKWAGPSGRAVWGVGLGRLVAGNEGSNPASGMDVCPRPSVLCCPERNRCDWKNRKKERKVINKKEKVVNTCFVFWRSWFQISARKPTIVIVFSWFPSVSPGKYMHISLKYAAIASFHILSNSLFINCAVSWRKIVWAAYSDVK